MAIPHRSALIGGLLALLVQLSLPTPLQAVVLGSVASTTELLTADRQ